MFVQTGKQTKKAVFFLSPEDFPHVTPSILSNKVLLVVLHHHLSTFSLPDAEYPLSLLKARYPLSNSSLLLTSVS